MSMLTPMLRYSNEVIGCWLTRPRGDRRERHAGHRHLLAESGLRREAFRRSGCGLASVRVLAFSR